MYVQENQKGGGYHVMPKPKDPIAVANSKFLDEFHGVDKKTYEHNPDWRNVELSQEELIILTTSTIKGFEELGLPRTPSNYAEVMKLNQQTVDEQCRIAQNRGLPIVLGKVTRDVVNMAKDRLSQIEKLTA